MDVAVIITISTYCAVVLVLVIGFRSIPADPLAKSDGFHTITIVVAVRNERPHLQALADQLKALDYPIDRFDVVFVDDHSTDGSRELVESLSDGKHLKQIVLTDDTGKKAAIAKAVAQSNADVIVTTDADCMVDTGWLRSINSAYSNPKIKMVVGGVRIEGNTTLFHKLQSLEFVSVQATGAATIGFGVPTMCNGANLSYLRQAFAEVGGYDASRRVTSGDDEFLLNEFARRWPESVTFMKSPSSIVSTSASMSVSDFFRQRLRWAGKWKVNSSTTTRGIALIIWLLQLMLILIPGLWLSGLIADRVFLFMFGAKVFVDFIFLFETSRFFRVPWSWISFLVLQLVYSPYVVYTGFMSQIVKPEWKGRAVETKV